MDKPNKDSVFFLPTLITKVILILGKGISGLKSKKIKELTWKCDKYFGIWERFLFFLTSMLTNLLSEFFT